ncbi:hypothetical protein ACQB6R_04390 [Propionibacteriaceae bacterium G1746]|uniref:hypothetical protein n=1 Tax=Aestuariimicrobium sp. G57 TaxID=3418485 RepID=UPI003C1A72D1
MPRTPSRLSGLIALSAAIALVAGCTSGTDSTIESPTNTASAPSVAASSASASPTSSTPRPTVPPAPAALVSEATTVFLHMASRAEQVKLDGGFTFEKVPPEYTKYLMGSALMNAVMDATDWHQNGYRLARGTEHLYNIKTYPAMDSGSLVALTGCLGQSDDYRLQDNTGAGWGRNDEQYIVYLKRDADGLLKVFEYTTLDVDSCSPRKASPALVAEAAKIYTDTFALYEKHLAAGGLNYQDYSKSGFEPLLAGEARNRIVWELEYYRTNDGTFAATGQSRPGRVTEWPRQRGKSLVALTSCFDRSTFTYTKGNGQEVLQGPRIYFAHFTRDSAGKLRMTQLEWIYVDACQ